MMALNPLNSTSLLASLGALGIFLVLFAETGLLIGFFLPGDSLLFTAGLLCTASASNKTHLSLPVVLPAAVGGALLGAQTGFFIGRKAGKPMLDRSKNRFLHRGAERSEATLSNIDAYLLPIIALVVVVSLLPAAIELIANRRAQRSVDP